MQISNIHFPSLPEDKSYTAMMNRYVRANTLAIVRSDRTVFESLRDIHTLLQENKKLKEDLEYLGNLKLENFGLREELERLKLSIEILKS